MNAFDVVLCPMWGLRTFSAALGQLVIRSLQGLKIVYLCFELTFIFLEVDLT